jgi:hypothetical protein
MDEEKYAELYEILEIEESASLTDIKVAYERLKKLYSSNSIVTQPIEDEFNQEDKEVIIQEITEAYQTLLRYTIEKDRKEKELEKTQTEEEIAPLELPEAPESLLESEPLLIEEIEEKELEDTAVEEVDEEEEELKEAAVIEDTGELIEVAEVEEKEDVEKVEEVEEGEEVEEVEEIEEAEEVEEVEEVEEEEISSVDTKELGDAVDTVKLSARAKKKIAKAYEKPRTLPEQEVSEIPEDPEVSDGFEISDVPQAPGVPETPGVTPDTTISMETGKPASIEDLDLDKMPIKGRNLRKVREKLGMGIHEIAVSTNISYKILVNIEKERFDKLPEAGYLRWNISTYAKALSLDPHRVADEYMKRYRIWQQRQE